MSMIEVIEKVARPHQVEACNVTFDMIMADEECHPIIGLPTGGGKSLVIPMLIDRILSHNIKHNILILCDRQEILEQDYDELVEYYQCDIGLYSSGLKSKTIHKITVAGIQSIYRNPKKFEKFDFVFIDECDSVNNDDKSMYRSFLAARKRRYIGLTATPYGLAGGMLYEDENSLFTCMSVDYTRGEKYLELVRQGYIANIIAFPTKIKFDDKKLKVIGGDYSSKSQSKQFDLEHITRGAMAEVVYMGKEFRRWLLFAIDIKHAENIGRILTEMGISNCVIHSKMTGDRKKILEESKTGKYRAIINVDILTIGYNDPLIDIAFLLYCTKSPRKHVQAPGRLRPDPKGIKDYKEFKVVADFGGNFKRMGPLNNVKIKSLKVEEEGGGGPMMKECPECNMLTHLSAKFCSNCDHEFVTEVKISEKSDIDTKIIQETFDQQEKTKPKLIGWANVDEVKYKRTSKPGYPDSVCVEYRCGMLIYKDYVSIDSNGYAYLSAKNWIDYRWEGDTKPPKTTDDFMANTEFFKKPNKIKIDKTGKRAKVVDCEF